MESDTVAEEKVSEPVPQVRRQFYTRDELLRIRHSMKVYHFNSSQFQIF